MKEETIHIRGHILGHVFAKEADAPAPKKPAPDNQAAPPRETDDERLIRLFSRPNKYN